MFVSSLLFCFYFVQFSTAFHGSGNWFGFAFGFQKLCFCRCGLSQRRISNSVRNGKLLGGEMAEPHQFPWLAMVHTRFQSFGGSLISERHIVTAASPLYEVPVASVTVSLGVHDRCGIGSLASLNSSVSTIHIHPAFSPTKMNYDIALVRLTHAVVFNQFIAPICLPFLDSQDTERVAWIASYQESPSSWLSSSSSFCTPSVASLPVLPLRTCVQGARNAVQVTSDKGCLGPLGAKSIICETDVGAPVMWQWTARTFQIIGVISSSSCDNQNTPLFTKIMDHLYWIQYYTRDDCKCF